MSKRMPTKSIICLRSILASRETIISQRISRPGVPIGFISVCVLVFLIFGGAIVSPGCNRKETPKYSAQGADARSKPFVASSRREIYHRSDCRWAAKISDDNLLGYDTAAAAEADGYRPCKVCQPDQEELNLYISPDRLKVSIGLSSAENEDDAVGLVTVENILERYWYRRPLKGVGLFGYRNPNKDVEFNGRPAHQIWYFLDGYPSATMPSISVYTDSETKTHFMGLETVTSSSSIAGNSVDDVVQNKRHTRMIRLIMGELINRSADTLKNGVPSSISLPGFELIIRWKRGQSGYKNYLIRERPRHKK